MDTVVGQIRESKHMPNCDTIYAPGGLEADTEECYLRDGIPLNERTVECLLASASDRGIASSEYMAQ